MANLSELQKAFLQNLEAASQSSLTWVRPHPKRCAERQFHVYSDSIRGRFQKTLETFYPVSAKLVGSDFFLHMSNQYIARTKSAEPDLDQYGHDFAEFIKNYPEVSSLPYLADVARLEWALHRLSKTEEAPTFDFARLQQRDPSACYFELPRATSLIASAFPIHDIWTANQVEEPEELVLDAEGDFYFLVTQQSGNFVIQRLEAAEWQILTAVQQGLSLADICAHPNYQSLDSATLLPHCIQQAWITLAY